MDPFTLTLLCASAFFQLPPLLFFKVWVTEWHEMGFTYMYIFLQCVGAFPLYGMNRWLNGEDWQLRYRPPTAGKVTDFCGSLQQRCRAHFWMRGQTHHIIYIMKWNYIYIYFFFFLSFFSKYVLDLRVKLSKECCLYRSGTGAYQRERSPARFICIVVQPPSAAAWAMSLSHMKQTRTRGH